ncbi:hypothetical protein ANCDUO_10063 [Ancylostoma duodenale]|uniref:Neurotransmitter-gated ion-channel transmembrane domain-containing protein n=1 Tax=Ancylostoma duodenale TaxID=51022 RepID=A0A0C2GRV4_9BILA|nr:hypothetical protein ANCDUO_10063 [Ancylostoma duodenale]
MQFLLPCESGEKVTLGLTVLLAYSVFSFNIAESMPETSEQRRLIAPTKLQAILTLQLFNPAPPENQNFPSVSPRVKKAV